MVMLSGDAHMLAFDDGRNNRARRLRGGPGGAARSLRAPQGRAVFARAARRSGTASSRRCRSRTRAPRSPPRCRATGISARGTGRRRCPETRLRAALHRRGAASVRDAVATLGARRAPISRAEPRPATRAARGRRAGGPAGSRRRRRATPRSKSTASARPAARAPSTSMWKKSPTWMVVAAAAPLCVERQLEQPRVGLLDAPVVRVEHHVERAASGRRGRTSRAAVPLAFETTTSRTPSARRPSSAGTTSSGTCSQTLCTS